MEIKQLKDIDAETIAVFARLIKQLNPACPAPDEAFLKQVVDDRNTCVFVACQPAIVGTLTLVVVSTPSGSKAWIEDVVVDESTRKQGVGEKLVAHAVDFCRDLNVSSVNLTSTPARIEANKLYRRQGFVLRETNVYRLSLS